MRRLRALGVAYLGGCNALEWRVEEEPPQQVQGLGRGIGQHLLQGHGCLLLEGDLVVVISWRRSRPVRAGPCPAEPLLAPGHSVIMHSISLSVLLLLHGSPLCAQLGKSCVSARDRSEQTGDGTRTSSPASSRAGGAPELSQDREWEVRELWGYRREGVGQGTH